MKRPSIDSRSGIVSYNQFNYNLMSLAPPGWVYEWSQIVGALGSVLLSALLVVLYKRQQQQLAADHKALLEVSDVEWDRDTATLCLSNFGNGVATNLSLTTLVYTRSGEHRKYVTKSNHLKRRGKSGTWANTIQPGEDDVVFEGKSRVGEPAPQKYPNDWSSVNFSLFIKQMKVKDVTEVKYLHVVNGAELSGKRCLATVNPMTRSVNPQEFEREHSLENLPGFSEYGHDETFIAYLQPSSISKFLNIQYYRSIRIMNWLPRVSIRSRPTDSSGNNKVKRVILWKNIKERIGELREYV